MANGQTQQQQPQGILPMAYQWYSQTQPAQYYPGQTVAGMNPLQHAGIKHGIVTAGNLSKYYAPAIMGAGNQAIGGLQSFLSGGGAQIGDQFMQWMSPDEINAIQGNFEVNPFLEGQADAFAQQAQRAFERNVLPTTAARALGAGQMGSSRHGIAQGLATSDYNQQLQENLANMYSTAWQNAAQNQLTSRGQTLSALGTERQRATQAALQNAANQVNAWGIMPSMLNAYGNVGQIAAQMHMMPSQAMLAGGGMYQNQAQQQINAERDRWNYYQNQPYNRLTQYQQLLSGVPQQQGYGGGGATASNPWASGLYGAAAGMNLWGGIQNMLGGGGGGSSYWSGMPTG